MDQTMREVSDRVSALLEELVDLIKPQPCDNPDCDHSEEQLPDGPWMITGWALAIDITAEGKGEGRDDEVQTYTSLWRSSGLPSTQCLGLGQKIVDWGR